MSSTTTIAVAGGSSGLGRAIVNVLRDDVRYTPIILSRNANPKLEQESGVKVLAADYADADALRTLLEENNVVAVLSTMNTGMDTTPELNLVQAADQSKVTKRFIPNLWSMMLYKPEHAQSFPFAGLRLQVQGALQATALEWAAIYPGIFLDYYVIDIPSYLQPFASCVDVRENIAGVPGDGTQPVHFTWSEDIGRFVAGLLSLQKWDANHYFTVGDNKSFNEVLALAEKKKGVKFNVSYDDVEKLNKGEVTELPFHMTVYDSFGGEAVKPMVQGMFAAMYLFLIAGEATKREGAVSLNDLFPEIKPLGLEAAWDKFYQAK